MRRDSPADIRLALTRDDDKLIPAVAHFEVILPAGFPDDLRHRADRLVPVLVTEAVIDHLEVVDIDEKDAHAAASAADFLVEIRPVPLEAEAVVQAGQRVRHGQRVELLVELSGDHALSAVLHREHEHVDDALMQVHLRHRRRVVQHHEAEHDAVHVQRIKDRKRLFRELAQICQLRPRTCQIGVLLFGRGGVPAARGEHQRIGERQGVRCGQLAVPADRVVIKLIKEDVHVRAAEDLIVLLHSVEDFHGRDGREESRRQLILQIVVCFELPHVEIEILLEPEQLRGRMLRAAAGVGEAGRIRTVDFFLRLPAVDFSDEQVHGRRQHPPEVSAHRAESRLA